MSRASGQRPELRFGTSGWRGVLGEDFTAEGVARVGAALAARLRRQAGGGARVVVAHDTRFLADRMAALLARVLAGAGLRPLVARGPGSAAVPTPVASWAVRRRRAAAGLIVTASHNPPEYLGVKVVAPWGGAADRRFTRALEVHANRLRRAPPEAEPRGRCVDLVTPYAEALLAQLDRAALRGSRLRVVYDALHGTGAGVLDVILRRAGLAVDLRRGERDPLFGGGPPDPGPARLALLRRELRAGRGLRLGLATDGDADRYGVVDGDGRILREGEVLALLVDHLARTGRVRRGVAISVVTASLVEQVARSHGLAVERQPVGFKHLAPALREGRAELAGEESAGFAWAPFARDKDGILAGCFLAEMVAQSREPLGRRLGQLVAAHGPSSSGREALALRPAHAHGLAALRRAPPARFDGVRVLAADDRDGLRLQLADGFVMWRGSGTEPVLRIYAEARSATELARRLRAARRLLARAGGGR